MYFAVFLFTVVTLFGCGLFRRELSAWWFHLHRALSVVGLVLAIAGAATGGNLQTDVYHGGSADSAHKALGGLTVAAAAIQVSHTTIRRGTLCTESASESLLDSRYVSACSVCTSSVNPGCTVCNRYAICNNAACNQT